jgi:hypothetical protein
MTKEPVRCRAKVRTLMLFVCLYFSLWLSLTLSVILPLSPLTLLLIVVLIVHYGGCHVCICHSSLLVVTRRRSLSLVVARCHSSSLVISLSLSCMHTHTATLSLSSSTHSLSLLLIAVFLSFFSDCVIVAHGIFVRRTLLPSRVTRHHPPSHRSPPYRSYVQYCSLFVTALYPACRSYQIVSSSVNSFELKK